MEGRIGQDKTRQDRTRQDKRRQDPAGQDKTGQDKTRQDKTRQDKTRQYKTRQDKTRQDTIVQSMKSRANSFALRWPSHEQHENNIIVQRQSGSYHLPALIAAFARVDR